METRMACPECGAIWQEGQACVDHFDRMLAWEFEDPGGAGAVHHLTVLCYQLQHPSRYSREGLNEAKQLLVEFVERGVSPDEMRQRNRARVDSGKRHWNIKATPTSIGSYPNPIPWTMTAADVTAGGLDGYGNRVREWARSVYKTLKTSDNFSDAKAP